MAASSLGAIRVPAGMVKRKRQAKAIFTFVEGVLSIKIDNTVAEMRAAGYRDLSRIDWRLQTGTSSRHDIAFVARACSDFDSAPRYCHPRRLPHTVKYKSSPRRVGDHAGVKIP